MKIKVAFIINGSKAKNKKTLKVLDAVNSIEQIQPKILLTEHSKHAISLSKQMADNGCEMVIAVGGDGTCNEVINGIMQSKFKDQVVFGIVPNGSGNDFHRMLGQFNPQKFIEAILSKKNQYIDLIRIDMNRISTYVLNIAGVGFDGHVVQTLNNQRSRFLMKGKFAYMAAILRSFYTYKTQQVVVESDEFKQSGKMLIMAVCNGKVFGHGLTISPDACFDDGYMDVTHFGDVSLMDYVKNIGRLKRGVKIEHPKVNYKKTKSISVKMKEKPLYIEADGELVADGDVIFKIQSKAIKLLIPDY